MVQDEISVKKLWKQYENGTIAIKNINFGVEKGKIFGLLGRNGAGKTTLFSILTSLIPKTSG